MRKLMILPVMCFFFLITSNGIAFGEFLTEYLSIPGIAFLPASDDHSYNRENSDVVPTNDASDVWFAPLYLPDGARIGTVTSLAAIICGNFTKETELDIGVWERDLGEAGTLTELVHLDIDGTDYECTLVGNALSRMSATKIIIDPPIIPKPEIIKTIDNETKVYFITVDGLTGAEFSRYGRLQLRGVRIKYSLKAGFNLD